MPTVTYPSDLPPANPTPPRNSPPTTSFTLLAFLIHLLCTTSGHPPTDTSGVVHTSDGAELWDGDSARSPQCPRTELTPLTVNTTPSVDNPEQNNTLDAFSHVKFSLPNPVTIQGWDSTATTENQNPLQAIDWLNDESDKLLTYRSDGGKIGDLESMAILCDLIKSSLDTETNPIIASPVPESSNRKKYQGPFCALVKDITPEQIQSLIARVSTSQLPRRNIRLTTHTEVHLIPSHDCLLHPLHPPSLRVCDHAHRVSVRQQE